MTRKARKNLWPSSGRLGKETLSRHILLLPGVKWFVPSTWRYLRWPTRLIAGFLAAAAALTFGSHVIGAWYASRTELDQEEVWSAYLNHEIRIQTAEYAGRSGTPPLIVVQDRTQGAYRPWLLGLAWPAVALSNQGLRSRIHSLQTGTYWRYLIGNLGSHPVRRRLNLSGSYRLVDSDTVALYGQAGARWETLFPQSVGYFVLSTVGFSSDHTQALLQVDHFCGLCGHGGYVLMRKVARNWVIEAEAGTWIS